MPDRKRTEIHLCRLLLILRGEAGQANSVVVIVHHDYQARTKRIS
jgi:hypothetical protein